MAFNGQGRPPGSLDPRIIQQVAQLRAAQSRMPGMVPGAGILGNPFPMSQMIPQMMPQMMPNTIPNPHLAPLIQGMRGLPQYAAAAAAVRAAQMQQNLQRIAVATAQMLQNQRMPQQAGILQGQRMPQQAAGMMQGQRMPQQAAGMMQGQGMPQQVAGIMQGQMMPQQAAGMMQSQRMPQPAAGLVQGQPNMHTGLATSSPMQMPSMIGNTPLNVPGSVAQPQMNMATNASHINHVNHLAMNQGQNMQAVQQGIQHRIQQCVQQGTLTTQALPNTLLSGQLPVPNSLNQNSMNGILGQMPAHDDHMQNDQLSISGTSARDQREGDRYSRSSRDSRVREKSDRDRDRDRRDDGRGERDRERRRSPRNYHSPRSRRSDNDSRDHDAPSLKRSRSERDLEDDNRHRRGSSRSRDSVDVNRSRARSISRDISLARESSRPRDRSRVRDSRSRGESVRSETRGRKRTREPSLDRSVRPDVLKGVTENNGADEKPQKPEEEGVEDNEDMSFADESLIQDLLKSMNLGESGEEEIDLNEESQDVLSKEKAYLELKARKKQEEMVDQMRGSPIPEWIRSSPADIYYKRDGDSQNIVSTKRMMDLAEKFEKDLVTLAAKVRASKPKYEPPPRLNPILTHKHHCTGNHGSSSSESDSDESDDDDIEITWMDELNRKQEHPERLHRELWFNEKDEMNDGPLCRCSLKARKSGIRHNIYPGESGFPACDKFSNNAEKLYHYRITMSPHTNFLTKNPTIIEHDNHEYIFEGFSLFSHYKLENVPACKVIRFNIEYTIHWFEDDMPENFDVKSLDLFMDYLFYEILELDDLDWKPSDPEQCARFHIMPRFLRGLSDNGKEMLSMNEVLLYLLRSSKPLIRKDDLSILAKLANHDWQDMVDGLRGMIVSYPGMRPSSIRIDQLDREQMKEDDTVYPIIIHFGIRPAQLSYAGDPNYQKLWKQYVKFKHLLANKPKVTTEDKQKLVLKEEQLQEMRTKSNMKREVTVELTAEGFYKTGLRSDMCQHAMLLPVLISHLRFHRCLDVLEVDICYTFKDRMLLQLALTHPSYRVNFGTNPDHARNSLSNCGIRQPEYGDSRIHHVNTRKRGINILINIMSRLGRKEETRSEINHYERLEFLGDAVVEFLSSIHLFFMFPSLEEGGLATYRAAIVQNQHLAVLAKKLKLQEFMLYAHGPDLCRESDLRHAMANCLEALMGALYLDGGIDLADRVYGEVLFDDDVELLSTWLNLPPHPLQEDEPDGDRHWLASSPALQKLVTFEEDTGLRFNHIRLLARSFTMRNVGYNNLTLGHNQRLEFLGDTVLQLVASAYLFKHFPEHHEGHLSLLRSSLVNNRTQAVVCDDLGMTKYIIYAENRILMEQGGMKHKEKADLLEALIGALYVDRDLETCEVFCHVCFFPRLKMFIMNQDWNDPKSQLQQCCLTLRELDGGEPDIPTYKVIAATGPTNTRRYTVAVYFRDERLATGIGHSIQQAEMNAATNALQEKSDLFPQLQHQKRFIEKKYRKKKRQDRNRKDDRNQGRQRDRQRDDWDQKRRRGDAENRGPNRTDRGDAKNRGPNRTDRGDTEHRRTNRGDTENRGPNRTDRGDTEHRSPNRTNRGDTENRGPNRTDRGDTENRGPNRTDRGDTDNRSPNRTDRGDTENRGPNRTDRGDAENRSPNRTDRGDTENKGPNRSDRGDTENRGSNRTDRGDTDNKGPNRTDRSWRRRNNSRDRQDTRGRRQDEQSPRGGDRPQGRGRRDNNTRDRRDLPERRKDDHNARDSSGSRRRDYDSRHRERREIVSEQGTDTGSKTRDGQTSECGLQDYQGLDESKSATCEMSTGSHHRRHRGRKEFDSKHGADISSKSRYEQTAESSSQEYQESNKSKSATGENSTENYRDRQRKRKELDSKQGADSCSKSRHEKTAASDKSAMSEHLTENDNKPAAKQDHKMEQLKDSSENSSQPV